VRPRLRKSKPKRQNLQLLVRVVFHRQTLNRIQAGRAEFGVIQLGLLAEAGCHASVDFADANYVERN